MTANPFALEASVGLDKDVDEVLHLYGDPGIRL
jgi:hypothetical protein